jgi:hypothetical protein
MILAFIFRAYAPEAKKRSHCIGRVPKASGGGFFVLNTLLNNLYT